MKQRKLYAALTAAALGVTAMLPGSAAAAANVKGSPAKAAPAAGAIGAPATTTRPAAVPYILTTTTPAPVIATTTTTTDPSEPVNPDRVRVSYLFYRQETGELVPGLNFRLYLQEYEYGDPDAEEPHNTQVGEPILLDSWNTTDANPYVYIDDDFPEAPKHGYYSVYIVSDELPYGMCYHETRKTIQSGLAGLYRGTNHDFAFALQDDKLKDVVYPASGTYDEQLLFVDSVTGEPISGLDVRLYNAETEEEVCRWTSGSEPEVISGLPYTFADREAFSSSPRYIAQVMNLDEMGYKMVYGGDVDYVSLSASYRILYDPTAETSVSRILLQSTDPDAPQFTYPTTMTMLTTTTNTTTTTTTITYTGTQLTSETNLTIPTTTTEPATTTTTTTTTTIIATDAPHSTAGDVNEDGKVDVKDAVLAARLIAEDKTAAISDTGRANADVDGTRGLSDADLTTLLQFIAGKRQTLR